jgi:hypothetical protein
LEYPNQDLPYIWPNGYGSSGQSLSTDGTGQLSWSSGSGYSGYSGKSGYSGYSGSSGSGFVWRGQWTTLTGYSVNDTVLNNGTSYVCTSAHVSGGTTQPGVGAGWAAVWSVMAQSGFSGYSGSSGFSGYSGISGYSGYSGTPAGSNTQVQFNDSSSFGGDADLTWDKTNNVLNVAQSTAGTKGTLTVNAGSASRPAILITGQSADGTSDTTGGTVLYATHNGSGNRQFVIGASENYLSATASVFRYLTGSSIATIDGICGDGSNRCPINLGTDTSSVAIGNNALAYNASLSGKLAIYAESGGVGLSVIRNSAGTGDLARFCDNTPTALSVVNSAGKIGAVQTSPTAYVHLGAGTASANTAPLKFTSGTHLTTPETGAMEFNGTHFYGSVGTTRYQLDQTSRCLLTFQLAASTALTTTAVYLKDGEIQLTATKGIVILAACTIEGMSINTDITLTGGVGRAVKLMVYKNGSEVASVSTGLDAAGADTKAYNNTAGSASFAANDILSVAMVMTGSKVPAATVVNTLGLVELRYTL